MPTTTDVDDMKNYIPSESELEILQILWQKEPATVRAIHEELIKKKKVGYTTTLKQFQRLTEKGVLEKITSGKAHEYKTLISPESVKTRFFDKLLNTVFKGSTSALLMHALGNSTASEDELRQLEAFIQQKKKDGK